VSAEPVVSISAVTQTDEGGHVAAAWILLGDAGIRGSVSCVQDGWSGGYSHVGPDPVSDELLDDGWHASLLGMPMPAAVREYVETLAMILLAGSAGVSVRASRERFTVANSLTPAEAAPIVAAIARGETQQDSDSLRVDRLLAGVCASPEEAGAYRAWLQCRVDRLAEMDGFRLVATAIAHELTVHAVIDRGTVIRTIAHALDLPEGVTP
jgi:hypothetical protein